MRAERIVRHQLIGDLACERLIESAANVDRRELVALALQIGFQLPALALEVRLFGIGLRMHRHVFARRHRHRAGDERSQRGATTSAWVAFAAATPATRLAVDTMPSLAPSTAARSQPIRLVRWRSR